MAEAGRFDPEGAIDHDLTKGVGRVIDPAQHVGHPHVGVVDGVGEDEPGRPVRAHQDEILRLLRRLGLPAENQVIV